MKDVRSKRRNGVKDVRSQGDVESVAARPGTVPVALDICEWGVLISKALQQPETVPAAA